MPAYFLDTSAFAKLYHKEAGSEYVIRLVEQSGPTAIVSRLAVLEIESVFPTKFRTGELDAFGQETCRRSMRADLSQGRIQVGSRIEEHHYLNAHKLLIEYGSKMALRTSGRPARRRPETLPNCGNVWFRDDQSGRFRDCGSLGAFRIAPLRFSCFGKRHITPS